MGHESALSQEKRGHTRIALGIEVTAEPEGVEPFSCFARDISIGGMFIESEERLAFGTKITIELQLPGEEAVLRLPGIVRWTNTSGFGVQFGLLGARDTHLITGLGSQSLG